MKIEDLIDKLNIIFEDHGKDRNLEVEVEIEIIENTERIDAFTIYDVEYDKKDEIVYIIV